MARTRSEANAKSKVAAAKNVSSTASTTTAPTITVPKRIKKKAPKSILASKPTSDYFDFLALPFEIRERIYELAAASCSERPHLRARNVAEFRQPHEKLSEAEREPERQKGNQRSLPSAHRHTLHNLTRVNKALYDEAMSALYRYVPMLVQLGSRNLRDVLELGKRTRRSQGNEMLQELRRCSHIMLGHARLYRHRNHQAVLEAKRGINGFLDWWFTEGNHRPQARLIVLLNHFYYLDDNLLDTVDTWLKTHNDLNTDSLRFSFGGNSFIEHNVTTCSIPSGFYMHHYEMKQITKIRDFCRRHHRLIDSSVDWSTIGKGPLDGLGNEIVTMRQ